MQSMDIVRSHKPVLALQFESEIRLIWRDDQFRRLSPFKWNSPYTYSNIYESERNFHKIFMEVFQLFDGSVISFNHPFTSALSISNWVSCCLTDSFVYQLKLQYMLLNVIHFKLGYKGELKASFRSEFCRSADRDICSTMKQKK